MKFGNGIECVEKAGEITRNKKTGVNLTNYQTQEHFTNNKSSKARFFLINISFTKISLKHKVMHMMFICETLSFFLKA